MLYCLCSKRATKTNKRGKEKMTNAIVVLVASAVAYVLYSRWARVTAQELKDYNKALENSCEAILDTQAISKKYPKEVLEKAVKYAKK